MSNATRTIGQVNARDVLAGIGVQVIVGPLADRFPGMGGRFAAARGVLADELGAELTVYLAPGLDIATTNEVLDDALSPACVPADNPWVGGPNGARYLPL